MKLYGVTTTYNCEEIVPYVMKYAEELGYDKLVVLDNESTDRTVELLKQYDFVEVRTFHTDCYDEIKRIEKIVNAILEFETDDEITWVTAADFDEVFYYAQQDKDTFKDFLVKMTNNGFNICTEHMVNLVYSGDGFLDEKEFLHFQIKKCGYANPFDWCKPILFRLDNLSTLGYIIGKHKGNFCFSDEPPKQFYNTKHLHVFHLKYALGFDFVLKTALSYNKRTFKFDKNVANGDYRKPEIVKREFERTLANSISTSAYLEHKMLNGNDEYEHNDSLISFKNFSYD